MGTACVVVLDVWAWVVRLGGGFFGSGGWVGVGGVSGEGLES